MPWIKKTVCKHHVCGLEIVSTVLQRRQRSDDDQTTMMMIRRQGRKRRKKGKHRPVKGVCPLDVGDHVGDVKDGLAPGNHGFDGDVAPEDARAGVGGLEEAKLGADLPEPSAIRIGDGDAEQIDGALRIEIVALDLTFRFDLI